MSDTIYLDHNATTPCDPRVVEAMLPYFSDCAANPTSRSHRPGQEAAAALEKARATLADAIGGRSASEVFFTAGATEANNLAILGVASAHQGRGRHLISQCTEHASVLGPAWELERRGWKVTLLGVDRNGRVRLDELQRALRDDTALVSIMLANNETGVIQPVADAAALTRERGVLVHCDAVQGLGKVEVDVGELGVDLLSLSAHKCYGPKGVGALWVRRARPPVPLRPVLFGGGQEACLRPGTPNVPGAVGFARAAELAAANDAARVARLRDRLEAVLVAGFEGAIVNGAAADRLPNTSSVTLPGLEANALLVSLPDVAAATGSACTSSQPEPSRVLRGMGLSRKLAAASVRLSLGRSTTRAEVDRAAERILQEAKRLCTVSR